MTRKLKLAPDGEKAREPVVLEAKEEARSTDNNPLHIRHGIDIFHRHKALPAGFKRRAKREKWSFVFGQQVEFLTRTKEGYGSSGIVPVRVFQQAWDNDPAKEGGIVGYRVVDLSRPDPTAK